MGLPGTDLALDQALREKLKEQQGNGFGTIENIATRIARLTKGQLHIELINVDPNGHEATVLLLTKGERLVGHFPVQMTRKRN